MIFFEFLEAGEFYHAFFNWPNVLSNNKKTTSNNVAST